MFDEVNAEDIKLVIDEMRKVQIVIRGFSHSFGMIMQDQSRRGFFSDRAFGDYPDDRTDLIYRAESDASAIDQGKSVIKKQQINGFGIRAHKQAFTVLHYFFKRVKLFWRTELLKGAPFGKGHSKLYKNGGALAYTVDQHKLVDLGRGNSVYRAKAFKQIVSHTVGILSWDRIKQQELEQFVIRKRIRARSDKSGSHTGSVS